MANSNAAPRIDLQGFDDQSARALPIEPEQIPVHLPLIFTYAQKGNLPAIVSGQSLIQLFGAETINYRGPYVNHATPLINAMNGAANMMMIHRLKPADATTATLRLSLDLLSTDIPLYERNADGSYVVDGSGDPVPVVDDLTTPGFIGKWVLTEVTGAIGAAAQGAGTQTDGVSTSVLYPVMDFQVSSFGSYGNNIGVRLSAPTTKGTEPVDDALALEQLAYLYRIQVMQRKDKFSTPTTNKTITQEQFVEFALKEGAVNTNFDSELFVDKVVLGAYRDLEAAVPEYGPFDTLYVYHDNVAAISADIFATEQTLSTLPDDGEYLVNLFGATTLDGAPFHSFVLQGLLDGAVELTATSTQWCLGGNDGTMTAASFDVDVAHQLENFGQLDIPYADMAKYPFSVVYDTGFSIDTKKLLGNVLGLRKDVSIAGCTQDVALPALSISEESSMAIALRTAFRTFPESTVYGTATCRAVIVAHAGTLVGSSYGSKVPAIIDLAIKRARYMGAGNGIFKGIYSYDVAPNNQLEFVKDINNPYAPQSVRNRDWDNGLVWAQYYDTKTLFFPGFQTVYDDDTSVLNSDINMLIATELNKVCFRTWRDLSGNAKLTNDQFIERSDELIRQYTNNRFDGRVVIVPETFYSEGDVARGYSWSCKIHMYANNMKTVLAATVVTHRLEDL